MEHERRFSLDNDALWYLVVAHDGKRVFQFETRHEATGSLTRLHEANDYEVRPVTPLPLDESAPVYKPERDGHRLLKHPFSRRGCCV